MRVSLIFVSSRLDSVGPKYKFVLRGKGIVDRVAGTSADADSRLLAPQDSSHTLALQKSASKKVGRS